MAVCLAISTQYTNVTDTQPARQIASQPDRHPPRQTPSQPDRHPARQPDRHTDISREQQPRGRNTLQQIFPRQLLISTLNSSKSEFLLIGLRQQLAKIYHGRSQGGGALGSWDPPNPIPQKKILMIKRVGLRMHSAYLSNSFMRASTKGFRSSNL